jgi:hypothetical protein
VPEDWVMNIEGSKAGRPVSGAARRMGASRRWAPSATSATSTSSAIAERVRALMESLPFGEEVPEFEIPGSDDVRAWGE